MEQIPRNDKLGIEIPVVPASDEAEVERLTNTSELTHEQIFERLSSELDEDNISYLHELWEDEQDIEDLIAHAYQLLELEGKDADEILARLGIVKLH